MLDVKPDTAISVQGLSFVYKASARHAPVKALEDINLDVRRCEFLSLLGPSGCGKSTLLKVIAGLLQPTHGAVHVADGGRSEGVDNPLNLGMMFQQPVLLPWRTVRSNILLPG